MSRQGFYGTAALALAALVAAPLLLSGPARDASYGQAPQTAGPAEPAPAPTPVLEAPVIGPEMDDPAFGQYVNIFLLVDAWRGMHPGLMTDVALQLAEGERVLLRAHKAGSSQDLLALALKVALNKGDKDTLARIGKAAKAANNEALAAQVANATKLGGASRKEDPALQVGVDQSTPEQFAAYSQWLKDLRAAELIQDKAALDEMEKNLAGAAELTDKQKEYLKKVLGEAQKAASAGGAGDNSVADTLRKLEGSSRANALGIVGQILTNVGQATSRGHVTYGHGHNFGYSHGYSYGSGFGRPFSYSYSYGTRPPVYTHGYTYGTRPPVYTHGYAYGYTPPVYTHGYTHGYTPPVYTQGYTHGYTPPVYTHGYTYGQTTPVYTHGYTQGSIPPSYTHAYTYGHTTTQPRYYFSAGHWYRTP